MKRFAAVLMMLLVLAGCGQAETPVSEPEEVPQVTEPEEAVTPMPEEESRELCSVLGELLRQEERDYTVETLNPLLGDYGLWLDV